MITKEIKLNMIFADKMLRIIKDYEKEHIIEGTKYYEFENYFYIIFANKFDFDRVYPMILKSNLSFERTKIIADKNLIDEKYHKLIVEA